jgi:thiosulfate reductase cytochrome b subunit
MASQMKMQKIYLYTRFERFWHWIQSVLIAVLLITGFEVHGTFSLLGYERAVYWHNFTGLTWLVLFAFIVFWLLTTGEWKQYIPTTKKLFQVVHYYTSGIFRGLPHPVQKSKKSKHNPLQRLTYLGLTAVLLPLQMITGLLYYTYNSWESWGLGWLSLEVLAVVHILGAFAILSFILVHVYMTTTGHTVTAHIQAMFTGWEEVEDESEIDEWERVGGR